MKEVGCKPNVSDPGFSTYCLCKATPGGLWEAFVFSLVLVKEDDYK